MTRISFEAWFKSYNGLLDGEKRNGKDHFRAAFKSGRSGHDFLEFLGTEPLVYTMPQSAQAAIHLHLAKAHQAGRLT